MAFDPIKILTCWALQNDRQNLSFVKANNVVGEKMAGNTCKWPFHIFVIFVSKQSLIVNTFQKLHNQCHFIQDLHYSSSNKLPTYLSDGIFSWLKLAPHLLSILIDWIAVLFLDEQASHAKRGTE